jgi:hypothetical protein
MTTFAMIIFDVVALDGGEYAIGGTDEYTNVAADPVSTVAGRQVDIVLRAGVCLRTRVLEVTVHTALSGKRNIYLKVATPNVSANELARAVVVLNE